ncbi:enoyl-CoA hydratase/isomerase family protein [Streptomyces xinghaiensis]|uniref:enoyl-CoA hydratase/isomerase family protein n=1 Tax=Streptomyces xinghaiensis TaxID=1038928 RepID=UPI00344AEDE1
MRRENGVIELRLHTDDGPYIHNWAAHNAWSRVWQDVGNDPANRVLIITATGDSWFRGNPDKTWQKPIADEESDYIFQQIHDGWKLIESFVGNLDIPTIAAVNGPGIHTEFALLCDITLAVEEADFMDPHFLAGSAPRRRAGSRPAGAHGYQASCLPHLRRQADPGEDRSRARHRQ